VINDQRPALQGKREDGDEAQVKGRDSNECLPRPRGTKGESKVTGPELKTSNLNKEKSCNTTTEKEAMEKNTWIINK
jgi:hypothetical protein